MNVYKYNLVTNNHFSNSANIRKLIENYTVLNHKEHQEIPLFTLNYVFHFHRRFGDRLENTMDSVLSSLF